MEWTGVCKFILASDVGIKHPCAEMSYDPAP
jgi:hypothetical protein